jgi:hypothetical protein
MTELMTLIAVVAAFLHGACLGAYLVMLKYETETRELLDGCTQRQRDLDALKIDAAMCKRPVRA